MNTKNTLLFKKSILIFIFFLFISFSIKAQIYDNTNHSIQSYKKYKIEFEIKDEIKIDLRLLNSINFDKYIYLRKPSDRVEVIDDVTGMTIIIYSEEELKTVKEPCFKLLNNSNYNFDKKQ